MRWDALFADMAARADADEAEGFRAEVAARERSERASVRLTDRLAATRGVTLTLHLNDGSWCAGTVADGADEWVLIEGDDGRQHVIPVRAIATVEGLAGAGVVRGRVERGLTLAHVLRALARDRARVVAVTASGQTSGLVVAVAADHVDVAERGTAPVTVALAALVRVTAL